MSEEYTVLVFAEGGFERLVVVRGLDAARAFCDGVLAGAGMYGAGSVGVYIASEDEIPEDEMLAREPHGEVTRALRALAKQ